MLRVGEGREGWLPCAPAGVATWPDEVPDRTSGGTDQAGGTCSLGRIRAPRGTLTRRAACTGAEAGGPQMNALWLAVLVLLTTTLAGCEAIGTIFKAGMWSGIIAVVLVVLVIGFIAAKIRS
jgi:hypothetical protein